jgi:transcriptional regulator with XRE-family HTH domain
MASLGENLRREREMRGVTLQEISAATKIGVRFLQALENEDFGRLPGGIFTRSFIRAYAKYLGLDEERVLAEYHLVVPAKADLDIAHFPANKPDAKQAGSRGPVLAVFVAAVLLTGGYLLYRYTRASTEGGRATPTQGPAAETPPAVTPPRGPATPGADSATSGAGITAAPGEDRGVAPAAAGPEAPPPVIPEPEGGLVLQVAATERAWIAVDADGKMAMQRILAPGEIETLRAKDSFDVTTGNALGVVLTLNGETLRPLGRRGEVKSIHLTRQDAKRSSP